MPILNKRRFGNGLIKVVLLSTTAIVTPPTTGGGGTTTPPTTTTPPYVAPYVAPSTNSTKFFATPSMSAVSPGTAVTIAVEFNGIIPTSGSITATSSGSGSFAAATVPMDGSVKSFVYTPNAVGEHNISFSNTANLYNSAPAPLNVWTPSSGSAQTMAATLRLGDQSVHQRDVPTGKPAGFATANTLGWGEVWVNVDRAVPALFARIFDRRSSGWSSSVGSGTELTNGWTQVYGATTGAKQVRLLLPAIRAKQMTIELATDSVGTNPVRLSNCTAVGTVILLASRSQLTGYGRGYAMQDSDSNGHINKIVNWPLTCLSLASDVRYANTSGNWGRVANEVFDPPSYADTFYNEPTSNGTLEAGRLIDQQSGMMLGFTGISYIGGGFDNFVDMTTGKPTSSTYDTMQASTGGKARYYFLLGGSFDNVPNVPASYQTLFTQTPDWVMRNIPTVALVGIACGASGIFGSDGSRDIGYTRMSALIKQQEDALPHMVSLEDYHWNQFNNGHASQGARPPYVREHLRLLLSAERSSWGGIQTYNRGPTLSSTGTISGGKLHIPYKLNGATALSTIKFGYPDLKTFTLSTPSASDLVSLIAVYPAGGRAGDGTTTPIAVSNVVINPASPGNGYDGTLDITLTGGVTLSSYTVHYAADFNVSGGTGGDNNARTATVITDNLDPLNVGYGQHMRPKLDITIN